MGGDFGHRAGTVGIGKMLAGAAIIGTVGAAFVFALLSPPRGGPAGVAPTCRDGYVVADVKSPYSRNYHTVCLTGYIP